MAGVDERILQSYLAHLPERDFASSLACVLIAAEAESSLPEISRRWKLSNEEQRMIRAAIKHWQLYVDSDSLPWSTVQPRLVDRDAAIILNVAISIAKTRGLNEHGIALAREALSWPAERLDPPPLLTGDDLQRMGIPAGPAYKAILQSVRDKQLDGELSSQAAAIELARELNR
jgi:hypothetical protein